jgi:hypothetical protein
VHQMIQLSGALLVLAGFVLVQRGIVDSRSRAYLALNLVGAAVLAVDAWLGAQWGFFVLESTWSVVSAGGLVAAARRGRQTSSSSRRTENGMRQSSSASPSIVSRHS